MSPPDPLVDYYRSHESEVKSVEDHLATLEKLLELATGAQFASLKTDLAAMQGQLDTLNSQLVNLHAELDVVMRMIRVLAKPLDHISEKQDQLLAKPGPRPPW